MFYSRYLRAGITAVALGLIAGSSVPLGPVAPAMAQQQPSGFADVASSYWASEFIQALATRGIISGFPDGRFRPEQPVTRAEYAAMVSRAFNQPETRRSARFVDVPSGYWATAAIDQAYAMGFLSGYPGGLFQPSQNIPRAQVLVSLANGLSYRAGSTAALRAYEDAGTIPDYALPSVAAATEKQLVVNYPDRRRLNPNRAATRAEVAAFIYQALASQGAVAGLTSPYIVAASTPTRSAATVPAGVTVAVGYREAEQIVLLPTETLPIALELAQPLLDGGGRVVAPVGSEILGELRPRSGGSQFIAQSLMLPSGQRLPLAATSPVVTTTDTIQRGASVGEVLLGSALGSGAAAAIAGLTGDRRIDALEVLAGTATGTAAGLILGKEQVEVIRITPTTDLPLTLNQVLVLPQ